MAAGSVAGGVAVVSLMAAVTAARRQIERDLYRHTCRILPNVEIAGGAKGTIQSWPAASATVRCLVQTQRPSLTRGETVSDAMLPRPHTVSLPYDTAIKASYHVEWVEVGITLEVIGEPLAPGTNGLTMVVNCVEWTAP